MKRVRRAIFIWLLPNAFAQLLYCRILAALGKVAYGKCAGLNVTDSTALNRRV
jgi:hypothetical protein